MGTELEHGVGADTVSRRACRWALPDSRGGASITLTFVFASWLTTTGVFIASWVLYDGAKAIGLMEYGGAVTAILAIWLGREYRAAKQ